jgi:hypothetical protein
VLLKAVSSVFTGECGTQCAFWRSVHVHGTGSLPVGAAFHAALSVRPVFEVLALFDFCLVGGSSQLRAIEILDALKVSSRLDFGRSRSAVYVSRCTHVAGLCRTITN